MQQEQIDPRAENVSPENLLTVQNLSVSFSGGVQALSDLSFSVRPGESFALVGESGCGKSTTARAIMRLIRAPGRITGGKVLFEGRDLLSLPEQDMSTIRGKSIGMIFQNPLDSLNPVYRVGSQVEEAMIHHGVSRAEARKRTLQLFRDVEIPDAERRMQSYPHELSGGMRQRVMIAMMLSQSPQLLIADEPTTALDVTVEAQILEIMKEMREKTGTSILLITHNFGIVAEVADRVGIMYAGELVECGDVYQVFENPAHPYAQALLSSLPRIRKTEGRIQTIEGNVPRILEKKAECRFANRCPYATEQCRTQKPPVRELGGGHWIACHREVARA